ncbi:hypothetical protein SprV_0602083200 [Sparganum proliferum]
MQTNIFLFTLVIISLFDVGCGNKLCDWSKRLIPKNATGDITLEVPNVGSYWGGFLGSGKFWTYLWARGWCSYKEGYFRCPYTKHDDYDATALTFSNAEKLSYVMLNSEYPVTIHKPEQENIPGFYVKEGTALDICTDNITVRLLWAFNGNESDLQDISCYTDKHNICSGLRRVSAPSNGKCGYFMNDGRVTVGYDVRNKIASKSYYYCYADKQKTRALTYIIDWRGFSKSNPKPVTATQMVQQITTSGAAKLGASVSPPHCCRVLGNSRTEQSLSFSDVVALSATAPYLATTIFAADEDIQEGQLVVFLLLHRKLNVREDCVDMFFEFQHLIPFDDDEGVIHIPSPEFRSVVSEHRRRQPL